MMGAAYFYHLTRSPLEQALPQLLGRARDAGWRVAVIGPDKARLAWLDERLWLGPEDQFLAHGLAGGPHDADQPILLATADPANDPQCLMCIDGAGIDPDHLARLERACILFDGNDPAALQTARAQWKSLKTAGCKAQYWSEASGRWEKMAES